MKRPESALFADCSRPDLEEVALSIAEPPHAVCDSELQSGLRAYVGAPKDCGERLRLRANEVRGVAQLGFVRATFRKSEWPARTLASAKVLPSYGLEPEGEAVFTDEPKHSTHARKSGGDRALEIGKASAPPSFHLLFVDDLEPQQYVQGGDDIACAQDLGDDLGDQRHERVQLSLFQQGDELSNSGFYRRLARLATVAPRVSTLPRATACCGWLRQRTR